MFTASLALYTVAFGLLEKGQKEQYVVGVTNAKTKKLTLQLVNQMAQPVALVSGKGQIVFCNQHFETLASQGLGLTAFPNSIFKMVNEEETSGA
jgi:hypothetical protein